MDVLSSGRARDQILATCARNVWLLTATYNIALVVSHIQGANNNVADLLSRWKNTEENFKKLYQWVDSPIWVDTHMDLTLLNHEILRQ